MRNARTKSYFYQLETSNKDMDFLTLSVTDFFEANNTQCNCKLATLISDSKMECGCFNFNTLEKNGCEKQSNLMN